MEIAESTHHQEDKIVNRLSDKTVSPKRTFARFATMLAVAAATGLSAMAYEDLPWKFEGSTDRNPVSTQAEALAAEDILDTFAFSLGESSPIWFFTTFRRGMVVVAW